MIYYRIFVKNDYDIFVECIDGGMHEETVCKLVGVIVSRVREFYEECERKKVCKTEKECVEIGDKKLQKVYEK